jgi:hypothetical protein
LNSNAQSPVVAADLIAALSADKVGASAADGARVQVGSADANEDGGKDENRLVDFHRFVRCGIRSVDEKRLTLRRMVGGKLIFARERDLKDAGEVRLAHARVVGSGPFILAIDSSTGIGRSFNSGSSTLACRDSEYLFNGESSQLTKFKS